MRNESTLVEELSGILTTIKEKEIPTAVIFPEFGDLNLDSPPLSRDDYITSAGGPNPIPITNLLEERDRQIHAMNLSHASSIRWYNKLIIDIIKWLGIIIAAFSVWTSNLLEDLAENVIELIKEVIGASIEKLGQLYKGISSALFAIDSALQTAIGSNGDNVANAISTAKTAIDSVMAEIWDGVVNVGSAIVSAGGIFGTDADITFDNKSISFSLNSTAGQVQENVNAITQVQDDILASEANHAKSIEAVMAQYDHRILNFEGQAANLLDYNAHFESTIPGDRVNAINQNITDIGGLVA